MKRFIKGVEFINPSAIVRKRIQVNTLGETALEFDVVVVGGGNAALCAALSARDQGASTLVLEAAGEDEAGGNSRFTAGAMRVVYDGVDDLKRLMPDLTEAECARTDFGTYTEEQFFDDMGRVTQYRCDPELVEVLVRKSMPTLQWMRSKGVRFAPIYGRQAFKVDGKFKFWGGLTVEAHGGGPGLVEAMTAAAKRNAVEVWYKSRALSLIHDGGGVKGVVVRRGDQVLEIRSRAVVLAAGGFQANPEWRTRYLGPGWDLAKVRGTRFNTGDGIRMALDIGAAAAGNWSGCHAVGWERNAPEFGDLAVGDAFQKHSYPFGIMLNANGRRFVDEGADFRNYTYAKYGRVILDQPGQFAWQIFDAKVVHLLRDEYRIKQITKVTANSLEDLVTRLDGVDQANALKEVAAYNASVAADIPFNPNVKDGRNTPGLDVPKSNWANLIDTPPFEAYAVTCGVTFTFGGLRINRSAEVLSTDGYPIAGLYAAGEMVGGIFYFNYPGGTGLTCGSVFGKIAGAAAGLHTKRNQDASRVASLIDGA
jgi:tricarballylate dehydrogenase